MYRIAIFQNDLGVGGIQKSVVNLVKNLDYGKVEAELFLCEDGGIFPGSLPPELKVHIIGHIPGRYKYLPFDVAYSRAKLTLPETEPFDVAIDFNTYQPECAIGAISVPAEKRVMWIHNNVLIKYKNEWKYRVLFNAFKGKFKYFEEFVPCSGALEEPFRTLTGINDKPFAVINNYIDVSEIRAKSADPCDIEPDPGCLNFAAMGRLCHQKGYDIMLDAFSRACAQRSDLRLYILGDGEDLAKLKALSEDLGITDKVFFLGNKPNPYCYLNKMDAFISTSRYEGQPLNIKEAQVIGLPLYCTKNLEAYCDGLAGYSDITAALITAKKEPKRPDDLTEYNKKIIDSIMKL